MKHTTTLSFRGLFETVTYGLGVRYAAYCWNGVPKSHESKSPHAPASYPITQQEDPPVQVAKVCVDGSQSVFVCVCLLVG